ncbi:hypothetical protein FHS51_001436 [Sphingobium wenxiniae]|uniref:hypothetical protein n=1 Tax=Sphingobium wenxiniae (strain DSM 21828 / CGMCC 1.7748 / JZ-1) TaxID=595605 RepID=UPI0017C90FB4|nr:hypothetical protein [Sphingobium wenxiniae]MBB6191214.1 hypothetical protein [Sphingobium wenxiniae]
MIGQEPMRTISPLDIAKGSCGQFAVNNAARIWTQFWIAIHALGLRPTATRRPSSLPVRVTFPHGRQSSIAMLVSNPRFYEHLMGWPIGWSEPAQPVTGFAAWLRRSRGALSRLPIVASLPERAASS